MATKKSFSALVVGAFLWFSIAAKANNGVYPTHFPWDSGRFSELFGARGPNSGAPTGKLLYYGGPVISNVKAYVVFWGTKVDPTTVQKIGDYYANVSNSTYLDFLDEYNTFTKAVDGRQGTNQHIGRGKFMGAITITPSITATTFDDVDLQAEFQRQFAAGVLPKPDDNTLYMTYFPPGVTITVGGLQSCKDLCAYHSMAGTTPATPHFFYGVMPDLGGACALGCGLSSTPFDSLTAISAHEFAEAITDPFPTPGNNPAYPQAWNDSQGSEVGDLCEMGGGNNTLSTPSGTSYVVQSEWDNSANACTTKIWTSP